MSIQSQIERISSAKNDLTSWLTGKGVSVPNGTLLDELIPLLDNVETGGDGGGTNIPNPIVAGDTIVCGSLTAQQAVSQTMTKMYSINIAHAGTYRFKWRCTVASASGTVLRYCSSQLYQNGEAIADSLETMSETTAERSYDLACNVGDVIDLYATGRADTLTYRLNIDFFLACIDWDNGF